MVARALATITVGLLFSTAAEGSTIVYSALNPVSIPGISGFNTGGTDMDGLSVTATFADSTSQTLFWADAPAIGPEAGGVFGTGWGLFVNNSSTYNGQVWTYFAQANTPQLTSLVLDGSTGLTVFDTMFWEDAPAYSNGELRPEVPETSPGSGIYRGDQGTPGGTVIPAPPSVILSGLGLAVLVCVACFGWRRKPVMS